MSLTRRCIITDYDVSDQDQASFEEIRRLLTEALRLADGMAHHMLGIRIATALAEIPQPRAD